MEGDKVDVSGEVQQPIITTAPLVEAAAGEIIAAGMLLKPSPLGGGEATWTVDNAKELLRRVFDNYDAGEGSFIAKLEKQLDGASIGVKVLAAELVALQTLPLSNVRSHTKVRRIETILGWADEDTRIPDQVLAGLQAAGSFNGGTGFNMNQWRHLCWLARFVLRIREAEGALTDLLEDPLAFLRMTQSVPDDVPAIRYTLDYLVWPSFSEPIVNRDHRRRIRDAFAAIIGGPTGDSDTAIAEDLHNIRRAQQGESGEYVEWYREPYLSEWRSRGEDLAQRAWLVRQSQEGIAMLTAWLDGGFVSTRAQHLGAPKPGSSFDQVQAAVNAGYQHIDYSERRVRAQEYHRFLSQMKVDDFLLTAFKDKLYLGVVTGEAEYVDDETSRLRRRATWRAQPMGNTDLPAPLPRLLEEQGSVVDLTDGLSVISAWYAEDEVGEEVAELVPSSAPQPAVVPQLRDATTGLAAKLHVKREDLADVIRLLQTRQQIVFYGPPGTGKTYLAGKIARFLAGEEHGDHVKTVQFHPSYAYEDFFEGYRPSKAQGDNVGFSLEPGPLRRIAAEASLDGNRDKPYFLIIDEMNRGNLAKVFGELYFLLEYRDQGINLQYNPQQTFVLPPNLFIIGTMNTADRSIAMVDAAIRRRFAFVELHPQDGMISGLLERFLSANGKPPLRADLLNALNSEIEATNRDLMIGPSYFMKPYAESDQGLEEIWKYELLPLLEEQYFGRFNRDKVREKFGLAAMRRKAGVDVVPVDLVSEPDDGSAGGAGDVTGGAPSEPDETEA
jgi:5-methylcytosine-specific restriction protein B